MFSFFKSFFFLVILCFLTTPYIYADRIIMQDGKTLDGKIISFERDKGLEVDTDYGRLFVEFARIESFEIAEIKRYYMQSMMRWASESFLPLSP